MRMSWAKQRLCWDARNKEATLFLRWNLVVSWFHAPERSLSFCANGFLAYLCKKAKLSAQKYNHCCISCVTIGGVKKSSLFKPRTLVHKMWKLSHLCIDKVVALSNAWWEDFPPIYDLLDSKLRSGHSLMSMRTVHFDLRMHLWPIDQRKWVYYRLWEKRPSIWSWN